jgi:hypothetical protein
VSALWTPKCLNSALFASSFKTFPLPIPHI